MPDFQKMIEKLLTEVMSGSRDPIASQIANGAGHVPDDQLMVATYPLDQQTAISDKLAAMGAQGLDTRARRAAACAERSFSSVDSEAIGRIGANLIRATAQMGPGHAPELLGKALREAFEFGYSCGAGDAFIGAIE